MRNGDLAAQISAGGVRYKMNFGLNLPQVSEIATALTDGTLDGLDHKPTPQEIRDTARMLWANATTRESLLMAPMLFDIADIDSGEAAAMLAECPTTEVADVLCLKLLRNHPEAESIATRLYYADNSGDMQRYGAMRLIMNLLCIGKCDIAHAGKIARAETARDTTLTKALSRQIAAEVSAWAEG